MIAINVSHDDTFDVWDSSGNPVTGLVQGDFTVYIYDPTDTEVSGTATWSISELGHGLYEISFTPTSEGRWTIKVIHSTYLPSGLHTSYQVNDSTFDTIEDKIDIIDSNVDSILADTDTLEADLKSYMDTKETNLSGVIHTIYIDLSGVINTAYTDTSGVIDTSSAFLSGVIDNSANYVTNNISGYIDGVLLDITGLSIQMTRTLGLVQENQTLQTISKSATGKLTTGLKIIWNSGMTTALEYYDIYATYDDNDHPLLFRSVKR